jgi:hypothetical protein
MCSENAHEWAQKARNGFGFNFLQRHHKEDDEILNHIVTDDEPWISFVNVKALDAHTFTRHKSLNKPCLPES